MLTLREVKDAPEIKAVSKFCPDSAEFVALINQVTRKLARRGDWSGTVVPIFVCVRNGCVVWPRYVGRVRRINMCNQTVPVRNMWYEFMEGVNGCHSSWKSWMGGECQLLDQGQTSVLQDVMGDGRTIRAYARCQADFGKTMRIFGTDNNGQQLITKNTDGTWSAGTPITLANPFGSTSVFVRHVDYVTRDATQCPVDVYAYNATTNVLEDLAHYEPSETTPSYQRTKLGGSWPNSCSTSQSPGCCQARKGVLALVKLKFIPAIADTDLILIDNIDALVLEIQATKSREAGDLVSMAAFQRAAIEELNRDLEDNSPDDQFAVNDLTFGGRTFTNRCF